ncbi:MAG: heavy metal translocating P-type ATPase [Chthoniobacterales bacterium]
MSPFSLKKLWQHWGLSLQACACHHAAPNGEEEEWPLMALLAGLCFIFGIFGFVSSLYGNHPSMTLGLYVLAYLTGGWKATGEALNNLIKGELDIQFLMIAVAAGAATIGAWREGALLLFLFSASGAMEHFAMGRTKKAISALFHQAPKTARVLRDGKEEQIPVEALLPGMIVLVTTGEQIPVDLEIIKGESACDESNLTGEALPVKKDRGDTALSGTINLWGVLEGRVLRPASESSLQKIIRLIQQAQKLKAPSQRFTDRFGTHYTILILTVCTIMFFVWWLLLKKPAFFSTNEMPSAFYRAMTLLVVASPCALVLSVPSAILSAIASGARQGILYRGGAAIETLARVSIVALDKTGTITSGNLRLSTFECLEGEEEQLRKMAYSLARLSEHPLSRAIRRTAASWNVTTQEVEKFETLLGLGVKGIIDEKSYVMGSLRFIEQFKEQFHLRSTSSSPINSYKAGQGAVVWIAGEHLLGRMVFTDEIREEAALTLKKLHQEGLRTVMLTGDHHDAAKITGEKVGVGTILSELTPAQKVDALEELKQGGRFRVAMIGDGVNDAPCLAAADVGVAMGARGSDAALEQAEIVLMNDRIENFLLARILSEQARAIIYQNITIALGTVIIMMTAALFMPVPLTLGVAAHEGSTLIVVLNSLRLLRTKLRNTNCS